MTNMFTYTPDPQDPHARLWLAANIPGAAVAPKDEADKDEDDDLDDEDDDDEDFDDEDEDEETEDADESEEPA